MAIFHRVRRSDALLEDARRHQLGKFNDRGRVDIPSRFRSFLSTLDELIEDAEDCAWSCAEPLDFGFDEDADGFRLDGSE